MSINIKDLNNANYDSLQRIFMNTPYKEYIRYIYPRIGCEHMLPQIEHFFSEVGRCDERYIIDFDLKETDDTLTIGQMLRIASLTMDRNAEESYPDLDIKKIRRIGVMIVELLLIVPFGKFGLESYEIRKTYDVSEPQSYIKSLTHKKQ